MTPAGKPPLGAEYPVAFGGGPARWILDGLIALLVLLSSVPAPAQTDPLSAQRLAFETADQALQAGIRVPLDQFKDYPLYPYLLYRDLQQRITQNPAAEIHAFLSTYDDTPLASRLRAAWLRQLAATKRWEDFLHEYRAGDNEELDCWRRQALLNTSRQVEALTGIESVWMSGTALPAACDPLIVLWQKQSGVTPAQLWQRFSLAMDKGERRLASQLKNLLPPADQPLGELWLQVDDNPRFILEAARFDKDHPRTPAILLHGLQRWSNSDSVSAAAALDTLKQRYRFPAEQLAALERKLALYLASRSDPGALDRLTSLPASVVDTPVREWRIRVGLQRGDWTVVLTGLDQLQPQEKQLPAWQYWRGRALETLDRQAEAQHIYRQLAGQRDYYSFLAADRLGLPYQINDAPLQIPPEQLEVIAHLPSVQRARELYALGRYPDARTEWRFATTKLTKDELKKAAKLAQSWGWHDQAITTLADAKYWDDIELRFPLPYQQQIVALAQECNLDAAWIYAILRQESIFQPDARSTAGALGLMQITLATGRDIAKGLQLDPPTSYDLLKTDLNIRYGVRYLRSTLDQLQGNPVLASAAYNAGPTKVISWLPQKEAMEADRWAELIPYSETRTYVKRVMEYATVYEHRLGRTGNSLRARMGLIAPAP